MINCKKKYCALKKSLGFNLDDSRKINDAVEGFVWMTSRNITNSFNAYLEMLTEWHFPNSDML